MEYNLKSCAYLWHLSSGCTGLDLLFLDRSNIKLPCVAGFSNEQLYMWSETRIFSLQSAFFKVETLIAEV